MRRLFFSDTDFARLFRDKLRSHKVQPTSNLWSRIESDLNGTKKVRNRKGGILIVTGTIIIALVSIGYFVETNLKHEAQITNSNVTSDVINAINHSNQSAANKQYPAVTESDRATAISSVTNISKQEPVFIQLEEDIDELLDVSQNMDYRKKPNETLTSIPFRSLRFNTFNNQANHIIETSYRQVVEDNPLLLNNTAPTNACNMRWYVQLGASYGNYRLLTNSFHNNPGTSVKFSPGYITTFQFGYRLSKRIAIQTGISGMRAEVNYESVNKNKRFGSLVKRDNSIQFTYAQCPLSIKYNLTGDCKRTIELQAGYVFSRYISGKSIINTLTYNIEEQDIKKNQHAVTLGIEAGSALTQNLSLRYGISASCNTSMLTSIESERLNDLYRPVPMFIAANIGLQLYK